MPRSSTTTECALCGDPVDTMARTTVRLSNTQPPWAMRSAIGAMAQGFVAVIRAAQDIPEETYWFHQGCWQEFRPLLNGRG